MHSASSKVLIQVSSRLNFLQPTSISMMTYDRPVQAIKGILLVPAYTSEAHVSLLGDSVQDATFRSSGNSAGG